MSLPDLDPSNDSRPRQPLGHKGACNLVQLSAIDHSTTGAAVRCPREHLEPTLNIDLLLEHLEGCTEFALCLDGDGDGARVNVEGLLLIDPNPDDTFTITPTGRRPGRWECDLAGLVSTLEELLRAIVA